MAPDTDALILVGQVLSAVKVEGLDGAGASGVGEVLGAAVGGQVGAVAGVLGDLKF